MEKLTTKRARLPQELPAIKTLYASLLDCDADRPELGTYLDAVTLRAQSRYAYFLLMADGTLPVGLIRGEIHVAMPGRINGPVGYVQEFYIVPEHRGTRGTAMLMDEVCRWINRAGCSQVYSNCTSDVSRHLFEAAGGTRLDYWQCSLARCEAYTTAKLRR